MSGQKRSSTTDLNHDNWDQEFEKEEKGVMKVAAEKDLQTRKIIHARRKLPPREGSTNSPFQGLNLFGAKPGTTPTFSFGMTSPSNVSGLFSSFSNNSTSSPFINKPSEDLTSDEPSAKRVRPNNSDDNQIVMEKTLTPIKEVCGSEEKEEEEEKVPPTPENVQVSSISQISVSPSNSNSNLNTTPTSKTNEKDIEENGERIKSRRTSFEIDGNQSQIKTSIELPSYETSSSDKVLEDDADQVEMPPDDDDW